MCIRDSIWCCATCSGYRHTSRAAAITCDIGLCGDRCAKRCCRLGDAHCLCCCTAICILHRYCIRSLCKGTKGPAYIGKGYPVNAVCIWCCATCSGYCHTSRAASITCDIGLCRYGCGKTRCRLGDAHCLCCLASIGILNSYCVRSLCKSCLLYTSRCV